MKDTMFLANFIKEHLIAGTLSKETADKIKQLWNKFKLPNIGLGCSVISADFATLGSLVIRTIDSLNEGTDIILTYKSGIYDYISIISNSTRRILWTDYKNIEPYNRNSGLYCDGASFESLGTPINHSTYREFDSSDNYTSNISLGLWGFDYNDFYGFVTFGIVLKNEDVDEFIKQLRIIINK